MAMPSRACHRGPPSCHSSTDTAHLTTSRNLELSGPLLTNGNGGGQEENHAALDTIDALIWSNKSMYLKQIDRFHKWTVSAWIPPGGM
ncbi:hypothetical protein KEM48_004757 [Puccinia striiformis f. sp. tritici PST-130]|nr:hypothetical protein KEM48_004757 [Puccinia striiformis f. sp. tritici PST-130]